MGACWWIAAALAGSGPWVPGSGSGSVYLGVSAQQYRQLSTNTASGRNEATLGEGVNQLTATGVVSYGIAPRAEVELDVPVHFVHANRDDADLCETLGEGSCDETRSVGVLRGHVKVLLADEVAGAPISASVAAVVRFGALTARYRDRLTAIGEGTLDGGGTLSVGKSGALGEGYWSTALDLTGLYRVPNTRSYPLQRGDRAVPGSELHGQLDSFFSPRRVVALGPSVGFYWRPSGIDFDELVLDDVDRFAALRVMQLNVGAKLLFRDIHDNAFVLGIFRTAYAVNNPSDQVGVSAGISLQQLFQQRGE